MSFNAQQLYDLLPAIHRIRDIEGGGELHALLSIIAEQIELVEENIEQLYDDQFIETCAEWVVPYIGDLVGARGLLSGPAAVSSQRAQVANTLAYRRRKGTAAVIEQLARDITQWDTNVVEFFQVLATTQYMNHRRPGHFYAPDLRNWEPLDRIGTPFDSVPHTADVRRIASRRGKYNIPNIGIFLWRTRSYSLTDSPAFMLDARRFLFHPLGIDAPLYNLPRTERTITHLAGPMNVPMPLGRRSLAETLADQYGAEGSFVITVDGVDVDASEVHICNLSDLPAPPDNPHDWAHPPSGGIAIDPVLGRIAFAEDQSPGTVSVTYHYGFTADMGGGEYERADSFEAASDPPLQIRTVPGDFSTIQDALNDLGTSSGIIEIDDSGRYEETISIVLGADQKLELRASNGHRPVLITGGTIEIVGQPDSELVVNGLLIAGGGLHVADVDGDGGPAGLKLLRLRHCTLVPGMMLENDGTPVAPGTPSLVVDPADVNVEIDRSILGGIRMNEGSDLEAANSIIDATDPELIVLAAPDNASPGGTLTLRNCTVIGRIRVRMMPLVTNSILHAGEISGGDWDEPVRSERLQDGCVRFSYLPLSSRAPRRFHCQPADAADEGRIRPQFSSLDYGDARYCQLTQNCPKEIAEGADDESEMGAFHDLYRPQRESALRLRLDEYLRFGLEAGIFYAS